MEENTTVQAEQPVQSKSSNWKTIPTIITIIGCIYIIFTIFGGGSVLGAKDDLYINAAEDLIYNSLKNPYSATLHESYIVEKDDYGRAIVYLDITAENSFGGMVRSEYFVCIHEAKSDGTYRHNGSLSYCEANNINLEYLKEINCFGEPRSSS